MFVSVKVKTIASNAPSVVPGVNTIMNRSQVGDRKSLLVGGDDDDDDDDADLYTVESSQHSTSLRGKGNGLTSSSHLSNHNSNGKPTYSDDGDTNKRGGGGVVGGVVNGSKAVVGGVVGSGKAVVGGVVGGSKSVVGGVVGGSKALVGGVNQSATSLTKGVDVVLNRGAKKMDDFAHRSAKTIQGSANKVVGGVVGVGSSVVGVFNRNSSIVKEQDEQQEATAEAAKRQTHWRWCRWWWR
jgi:hypothetical protein